MISEFNATAEHQLLMRRKGPQGHTPRHGITREQLTRFYKRWNAVKAVIPAGVKDRIDDAISKGHTELEERGRYTYLWDAGHKSAPGYSSKVERDYIHLCLNMPDMARNY